MDLDRRSFIRRAIGATALIAGSGNLFAAEKDRPNILWLTCEDSNVTWFGCYGGVNAKTPNIDRLAKEGFKYTHCFANAPVCAPSRSTWITGIHALSTGTHPMRSRYDIPHDRIKYYPDYLRKAGYYCTNHKKTDYNIGGRTDNDCWNGKTKYGWQKRKDTQPFFAVINHKESHESRAFGNVNNTKHDPAKVELHAYHPDIPGIRKNYAHYQDAVTRMDANIGKALQQLEDDGLAEDTIVFFCSDHGGVLPRSKRFLFESGTHAPFIARIPEKYRHLWPAEKPGTEVDRLVSFVDMPKTWLSLAGAEVPDIMQGRIFLGPDDEGERDYHFSFRARMDERCDNARAVRNKRFLYIKNYMPYTPRGQRLNYLWKMKATKAWVAHHEAGKTDEITGRFFKPQPYVEELYDTREDPDNVANLAENPEYRKVLETMRPVLRDWQLRIHDSALMPESERVRRAKENDLTIYDMVRDKKLYDLPAYLDAADLALAQESANEGRLIGLLGHSDLVIRYWGVVGLFLLEQTTDACRAALTKALKDSSNEVRAMAAWGLIRCDEKEAGREAILDMLKNHSYATLKILNIIDWMDDDIDVYLPAIKALSVKSYEKRMQDYFLKTYG